MRYEQETSPSLGKKMHSGGGMLLLLLVNPHWWLMSLLSVCVCEGCILNVMHAVPGRILRQGQYEGFLYVPLDHV